MFGLSLVRGIVERVFRAEARAAAMQGILQGITDALEEITGQRPELPIDGVSEAVAALEDTSRNGGATRKRQTRRRKTAKT